MSLTLKRNKWEAEALRVNTEELLDWIRRIFPDDERVLAVADAKDLKTAFWQLISDGVIICQLVEKCSPASKWEDNASAPSPDIKVPYNAKAKPGSFLARDNVSHFLEGCKKLGVPDAALCEAGDVVEHKNEKQVINCLLHLSRIGVENGLIPPQIVQYEMEIDKFLVHDQKLDDSVASDDEPEAEVEVYVAEQYKLTDEQLQVIKSLFHQMDEIGSGELSQRDFADALLKDEQINKFIDEDDRFAGHFQNIHLATDVKQDLTGFLIWLSSPKVEPAPEETAPAASSSSATGTRPRRASSYLRDQNQFKYLPYVPIESDTIDVALAKEINEHKLDIHVRRIAITKKKKIHSHRSQGLYRIGDAQEKVYMRLIREVLMVRVRGEGWSGVRDYLMRKIGEEQFLEV